MKNASKTNQATSQQNNQMAQQSMLASFPALSTSQTHLMMLQNSAGNDAVNQWLNQDHTAHDTNGRFLPTAARTHMESRFKQNFSHVKIHTNEHGQQLANQHNAHAVTIGNNIYFNRGAFSPHTNQGRAILAHELTHVVQQNQSSGTRAPQSHLELEAAVAGHQAMAGHAPNIQFSAPTGQPQTLSKTAKILLGIGLGLLAGAAVGFGLFGILAAVGVASAATIGGIVGGVVGGLGALAGGLIGGLTHEDVKNTKPAPKHTLTLKELDNRTTYHDPKLRANPVRITRINRKVTISFTGEMNQQKPITLPGKHKGYTIQSISFSDKHHYLSITLVSADKQKQRSFQVTRTGKIINKPINATPASKAKSSAKAKAPAKPKTPAITKQDLPKNALPTNERVTQQRTKPITISGMEKNIKLGYWTLRINDKGYIPVTPTSRFNKNAEERDAVLSVLYKHIPTGRLTTTKSMLVSIPPRQNVKQSKPLIYRLTYKLPAQRGQQKTAEAEFIAESTVATAPQPPASFTIPNVGYRFVNMTEKYWKSHKTEQKHIFNWVDNQADGKFDQVIVVRVPVRRGHRETLFRVHGRKQNKQITSLIIEKIDGKKPTATAPSAGYHSKDAGDAQLDKLKERKQQVNRIGQIIGLEKHP